MFAFQTESILGACSLGQTHPMHKVHLPRMPVSPIVSLTGPVFHRGHAFLGAVPLMQLVSPPAAMGCSFASPPHERLLWLPSIKAHANRRRCHLPCFLRGQPARRLLGRVPLRFIDLVLGFGCRTEDQFHFKGETIMANKTQPIKTLRAGRIQTAIWENHSDKGLSLAKIPSA
jgi:hypothetical protein